MDNMIQCDYMASEAQTKYWESLKGKPTWSKGKKFSSKYKENLSEAHLGQKAWNKGIKLTAQQKVNQVIPKPKFKEDNAAWKGDKVGYSALHRWVQKNYGQPSECENCGTMEKRMYHWANLSGNYLRVRTDWKRLCVPCHKAYDLGRSMKSIGK